MAREIGIGDEVAITATIVKLIDGRASVSIPSYNFPHSIPAPAKAKLRDQVELIGEVRRVDAEDRRVTIAIGGLVTVDIHKVRLVTKYHPPRRRQLLVDRPD
jgi:hypothetical protein